MERNRVALVFLSLGVAGDQGIVHDCGKRQRTDTFRGIIGC
jgi:hypothetical protein